MGSSVFPEQLQKCKVTWGSVGKGLWGVEVEEGGPYPLEHLYLGGL